MGKTVKISTDIFEHPVVSKDHVHIVLWLYLVTKCASGDDDVSRGTIIAKMPELSKVLDLPEEVVFDCLLDFEREMILTMKQYSTGDLSITMKKSDLWDYIRVYKKNVPVVSDAELDAFFDKLWTMYPRQMGKAAVAKKQKLELYNIGLDGMTACIKRYLATMKGKEEYYYKGCNFFRYHYQDYLEKTNETHTHVQTAEDMAASLRARIEAKKDK